MSKFKIEYRKNESLLWGTSFTCFITDRRTDLTFIGNGKTKKDSRDEAWDDFYKWDNEQREFSYLESSFYYERSEDSQEDDNGYEESTNKTTVGKVNSKNEDEDDQEGQDDDHDDGFKLDPIVIEKLRPIIESVYSPLECLAIISSLESEHIERLKKTSLENWKDEIKYILWSIPDELKHRAELLELEMRWLNGREYWARAKYLVRYRVDYDLLKKYGLRPA